MPVAVILHRSASEGTLPWRPCFADLSSCLVASGLFAPLYCLSGRPAFALILATMILLALRVANTAKKRALRGEPLVITDLALAWQVIRFPSLYLPFLPCGWILLGILIWGTLAGALWIVACRETPAALWWVVAAAEPCCLLLILTPPGRRITSRALASFRLEFDPRKDARQFGPLGAALLHGLWHLAHPPVPRKDADGFPLPPDATAWRPALPPSVSPSPSTVSGSSVDPSSSRETPPAPERPSDLSSAPRASGTGGLGSREEPQIGAGNSAGPGILTGTSGREDGHLPNIFLVQAESFCDPREFSAAVPADVLACWDSLISQGQSGLLQTRAFGAYTLRTEYAVLTGMPPSSMGTYAFYPYLGALRHPVWSLAHHLRKLGYRTLCLHPFHREFFYRNRAMPNMGFDQFVTLENFPRRENWGPYVGDLCVADAMLDLIHEGEGPVFCFAITMESHGPWLPGRLRREFPGGDAPMLPDLDPAVCRYLEHLRHADQMLGRLRDGLAGADRPGILGWYGDHLPNLPSLIRSGETATPYVIWQTGAGAGDMIRRDIRPEDMGGCLLSRAGWR